MAQQEASALEEGLEEDCVTYQHVKILESAGIGMCVIQGVPGRNIISTPDVSHFAYCTEYPIVHSSNLFFMDAKGTNVPI